MNYGSASRFAAIARSRKRKICLIGTSQSSHLSDYRMPYAIYRRWPLDITAMWHPGNYGSYATGMSYISPSVAGVTSTALPPTSYGSGDPTPSVNIATAMPSLIEPIDSAPPKSLACTDIIQMAFDAVTGNIANSTEIGYFWFNKDLTFANGSNPFNGNSLRGKLLFWGDIETAKTTLRLVGSRSGSDGTGTNFTCSADQNLNSADVAFPAGSGTTKLSIRTTSTSTDERSKYASIAGALLYADGGAGAGTITDGASLMSVSNSSFSLFDMIQTINQTSLGLLWSKTIIPSLVVIEAGHNLETDEAADLDGADNGTVANRLKSIIGAVRAAHAEANISLGTNRSLDILLLVPWATGTTGGWGTATAATAYARALAYYDRAIAVAAETGCLVSSLFHYFGGVNPIAGLHPASDAECFKIVDAVEALIQQGTGDTLPLPIRPSLSR